MSGKTTLVTTAKELVSVAKKAVAGDTILLAPGTYGDVNLSGIRPSGTVTVRSADPDNDAVLESLKLTRVNNFTFSDIDIVNPLKVGESDRVAAATVNHSTNISLIGIDFRGSMNGNHFDDGRGLTVSNSSRITVLDSTFQQLKNAVGLGIVSDVIFAGNTVREVREGVNMTQVNGGLFERNFITDVIGDTSRGDHADAFQVHSGGSYLGSSDLVFRSNVIIADAQGIFIKSEGAARGVFHSDIVVDNNYYEGNFRNAISVTQASNVTITNNSVREGEGPGLAPGIVVGAVTNAVVTGNIAPLLVSRSDWKSTDLDMSGNIDTWDSATKQGIAVDLVFAAPLVDGEIDFSSLDAAGSASVDVVGIGFRAVEGIGGSGASVEALLGVYVPQFDQSFTSVAFL